MMEQLQERITDELIAGIGYGLVWAQGEAMDLLPELRSALDAAEARIAELEREVAAVEQRADYRPPWLRGLTA